MCSARSRSALYTTKRTLLPRPRACHTSQLHQSAVAIQNDTRVGAPSQYANLSVLLLRVAACGPLYALVESVVQRDLDGDDEQGFARAPDPDELESVPEFRDPVDSSGADRVRAKLEPALEIVAESDQVQLVAEADRDVQDESDKDEDAGEVKEATGMVPHEADQGFRQDAGSGEVGEGPEREVDGERGGEEDRRRDKDGCRLVAEER